MIPCPSCHKSVEILDKHLGTLFTCPHCNSVYFIDWNGQPELAQHEEEPPVYDEAPVQSPTLEPTQIFESPDNFESSQSIEEEAPVDAPSFETGPSFESEQGVSMEEPHDFSQTLDSYQPSTSSDTPDFSDVTEFANADTASGSLTYTVTIEGVESNHTLAGLREAMTDSRFAWDVDGLLSELAYGRIVLKRLSPAKASVLINRIKYLPLKVSWRQDVLSGL